MNRLERGARIKFNPLKTVAKVDERGRQKRQKTLSKIPARLDLETVLHSREKGCVA